MLLALLQSLGGDVSATDFQKHLFLFTRLYETNKSFEFLPYRFGCYSFQAVADKTKLVALGLLEDAKNWQLAKPELSYERALLPDERAGLKLYARHHGKRRGRALVRHVYRNYPYFAINSEIAEKYLSESEYAKVLAARPKRRRKQVFFTIGYEGQSIESYINQLIMNDVRLLVDVRKNPLSRKYGFSKSTLFGICKSFQIAYKHLPDLGIPGDLRRNLVNQRDYEQLFEHYEREILPQNIEWIDHLIQLLRQYKRLAITCFEREHSQCHRDRIAQSVAANSHTDIAVAHL